jgi:hypothetical protein
VLLSHLPLSPLLLTLAACASEPEGAGRSGRTQASPLGFEMASAEALGGPLRHREGGTLVWVEANQSLDNR